MSSSVESQKLIPPSQRNIVEATLDIRQIRAFLAIADTGSVTRAAEVLHVVQPAVSRQLKLLEEDVGAPLFERGRHGMVLTPDGRILMEHARRALRELDSARMEIRPTPGSIAGVVNVGLLPSSCELLAAPLVAALRAQYPGIQVSLSVGYTDHLSRWLESGEIDVALLYDPKPSPGLSVDPLLEEALSMCGPAAMGLRSDRPVKLEALGKAPLVLPSQPHILRGLVEHACAVAGIHITVAAETNALSVQKDLVVQGLGLSVLPSVAISSEIERGLLCAAPIDQQEFSRRIVMALPTTRRTSTAVRSVATVLQACMKEAVDSGVWVDSRWLAA
ncbi:MAG: bacterial regulatory helix-turn-helix, lysR family protein [Rhodoferax sp.]|nr:bacterial regulatory helix-turn-helix, lysR family protein [Rhodoferax sp.]